MGLPGRRMPRVRRRRPPIKRSPGDIFIRWFYYLHFGNFAGWQVKALWVFLGLVPVFLFVTGALMWWNRVLKPIRRARPEPVRAKELIA